MSLFLFDLDGTLIRSSLDEPRQDYAIVEVLPRRVERLQELFAHGNSVAIVTNQGGVAFKYVSVDAMQDKLVAAARACGITRDLRMVVGPISAEPQRPDVVSIYVCFHDVRGKAPFDNPVYAARRKPNPDMIWEATADYPEAAGIGVLMVGDRQEDEVAARNARVGFEWSHVFFGDAAA
jgi:HAD superfamily hydrolase (TIGR01662 family)